MNTGYAQNILYEIEKVNDPESPFDSIVILDMNTEWVWGPFSTNSEALTVFVQLINFSGKVKAQAWVTGG